MADIKITRFYPDATGYITSERSAPFATVSGALQYGKLLNGTIKRQNDGSYWGLFVNGKAIRVVGGVANQRDIDRATK